MSTMTKNGKVRHVTQGKVSTFLGFGWKLCPKSMIKHPVSPIKEILTDA